MAVLASQRLELFAFTPTIVAAAIDGNATLAATLALRVDDEWSNDDFREVLPLIASSVADDPGFADWTRLVVLSSSQMVIGAVGCLSYPDDDGVAEIGFGISPSFEGHGYATEAARELTKWVYRQHGVTEVIALCRVDNLASAAVLRKLARETGTAITEEGRMLTWSLHDPNDGEIDGTTAS